MNANNAIWFFLSFLTEIRNETYSNANGVDFYCESRGDGPLVVLVPDGSNDCGPYDNLAIELSNVTRRILELTDGYGCDVYIEATGHPSGVGQGLDMIRKMGTFVEFSVFSDPVTVDWSIIGDRKELNIYGAHLSPYCYPTVIKWRQNGIMPTDGVVSHKFSLDDWEEGFRLAATGDDNSLKVALIP